MTRAYLRLDPGFYERKLEQGYPLPAIAALVGCLCLAETQSRRGFFRDEPVLRALLGPAAKWVPFLRDRGDIVDRDGRIYIDGWEEWQEGDLTVKDRMARLRSRRGNVTDPTVTPIVTGRNSGSGSGALHGGGMSPVIKKGTHAGQHADCVVCDTMRGDAA